MTECVPACLVTESSAMSYIPIPLTSGTGTLVQVPQLNIRESANPYHNNYVQAQLSN